MPVRKFKNLQDMEDSLWRSSDDPSLHDAISRVWDFAEHVCRRRFPAGVYRHRSIEDAQRLRDEWEEANFRQFWERRKLRNNADESEPEGTPPS